MSNTCTICRHKEREQIENALACGQSLRDIAVQFGLKAHSNVAQHQTCIAAQLQDLKASHTTQLNESLLERLNRYRQVAERFLSDDSKAMAAFEFGNRDWVHPQFR